MATDIATLGIKIEAKDIKKAVSELDRLEKGGKDAEKSTKKLSKSFGGLKSAIAGVGLGFATKQIISQINKYSALSNQLKLVTKDAEDLAAVQTQLFDVAQESRGSLEGTIDLYSRLARSTKDLNLSNQDLLGVTETINQAIALSGASAASASAALFQLGQGLSAGALRGEELNSVMEQTPELARAIAEGLGIGIAQLREMGAAGELNAEAVIAALQKQAGAVSDSFNQTEKTVSQAFTQIENVALQTFGTLDDKELVGALNEFREILQDPAIKDGLQDMGTGLVQVVTYGIQATSVIGGLFSSVKQGSMEAAEEIGAQGLWGWLTSSAEESKKVLSELKGEIEGTSTALAEAVTNAGGGGDSEFALLRQQEINEQLLIDQQIADSISAGAAAENRFNELEAIKSNNEQIAIANSLHRLNEEAAERTHSKMKMDTTKNTLGVLASLQSSGSKKLFEIGKKAAMASALINTYEAVTLTMAKTPYPWNIPLAIAQGVAGAAQVSSISSQSFGGGGGGAPSVGGGASVPSLPSPNVPVPVPTDGTTAPREVTITLNGSGYSRENVRDLIDSINEELGDGSTLVAV